MEVAISKKDIISKLRREILLLQGFKPASTANSRFAGLNAIEAVFPNQVFPVGAIHEFISSEPEHAAAGGGFIGGLLNVLMQSGAACIWIGTSRKLFPGALNTFGIAPDRIIFIDLQREKDVLWVTEEALKCEGLAAVIAEIPKISFTESRRLQLAVEKSKVTGFILRTNAKQLSTTACVARWQIMPIASEPEKGMPGIGFPRWKVELLKVRNGNPGSWVVEWSAEGFRLINEKVEKLEITEHRRKIG